MARSKNLRLLSLLLAIKVLCATGLRYNNFFLSITIYLNFINWLKIFRLCLMHLDYILNQAGWQIFFRWIWYAKKKLPKSLERGEWALLCWILKNRIAWNFNWCKEYSKWHQFGFDWSPSLRFINKIVNDLVCSR